MNIWELFVAFILGLVEGLTEFAPVSSTGHMIIVDDLLLHSKQLFTEPVANTFKVVIQLFLDKSLHNQPEINRVHRYPS